MSEKSTPTVRPRLDYFESLLCDSDVVDLAMLRLECQKGIPEGRGVRAIVWRLLLNLLPPCRAKWSETLREKRQQYRSFCEDFIIDPKATANGYDPNPLKMQEGEKTVLGESRGEMCDVTGKDHPLALDSHSKWYVYFQDTEVREQIDRDVMRTHPDLDFFSGSSPSAELHREEMRRALFVFTKLNPGITYVQGMNEIYAPLYYVFRSYDHGEDGEFGHSGSAQHAEADAFFCFLDLMGDFRDNFCKQLDNSATGVRATIHRFSELLSKVDPSIYHHLTYTTQVDHHFFAFRWITLLLTQEFSFPDVLRLWDTLAAARPTTRQNLLLRVCIAMLISVKESLLNGDYTQNLKLLQRFPGCDMNELLQAAALISDKFPQD